MYFNGESILVLGLGISGISTVKALDKLGGKILISDSKSEEELKDILSELDGIEYEGYFSGAKLDLDKVEIIVKSPGIKPSNDTLVKAREKNIEIMTDLELAYRVSPTDNIITITGTNGKTTTTTIIGDIFKKAGKNVYLAGNIGYGILEKIVDAKEEDVFIIEASSFQLEDTSEFRPKIGLILNITPDHLDWHGSMENYIKSKKKIFANQRKDDLMVLNIEDATLKASEDEIKGNLIWFSVNGKLDEGICIEDGKIVYNTKGSSLEIMNVSDIPLLGKHNIENVMGSIGVSLGFGLDVKTIKTAIMEFKAVEHRIEYVDEIGGIRFYNDSKGTNPESTIKAIEAMDRETILIAGGYDKGSDYLDMMKSFDGKIKALVLMGETRDRIKAQAVESGYDERNIYYVEDMNQAVGKSFDLSSDGMNVLLSPACASWGMYNNYEERGRDFKGLVKNIKGDKVE